MSTNTVCTKLRWSKSKAPAAYLNRVEREGVGSLAIGQTVEPLHHHDRNDPRRDRSPARVGEQIGKILVGKQPMRVVGQQPKDRVLRQPRLACGSRGAVEIFLIGRAS
jgi:hypothetical protein